MMSACFHNAHNISLIPVILIHESKTLFGHRCIFWSQGYFLVSVSVKKPSSLFSDSLSSEVSSPGINDRSSFDLIQKTPCEM